MKSFIIIFSIILVKTSMAQMSAGFSVGVDPKEISLYNQTAEDGNNAYWNNGFSIGANVEYSISEKFTISGLFHYSHFNFDKYANTGMMIPEIRFLYAEGDNSELWRTSVEAKYYPSPHNRFKFFILSGLGVVIENLGTIKTHYSDMNGSLNSIYIIDTEVKNSLVHSLGLGVRTSIISGLFIDISALYYSNYDEIFQTFFGLNMGYQIL